MTANRVKDVGIGLALERFARRATEWTGSSWAFASALGVLVIWALAGPFFRFADTWQLVINTGTTIVTFLMVFLIQRSQNKDAQAVHLKLNELVAALEGASSRLINVEDLTEEEVRTLHQHYQGLVALAQRETSLTHSHSIEEAEARHRRKTRGGPASVAVTPPAPLGRLGAARNDSPARRRQPTFRPKILRKD
jgi:low affinity Fe/Cu permease